MTNFQWALMNVGCLGIISTVKLPRNRMMIIYRHWASKRNNVMCVTFAGVKHHNDRWKIVEGGQVKKNTKKNPFKVPFKGPEGYRY